jgi:nicotinamidase-related amidase
MIEAFGKSVPTSAGDLLTMRTALVIWDMQNGLVGNGPMVSTVTAGIKRLAEAARGSGRAVIYSQHYYLPCELEDEAWVFSRLRYTRCTEPERIRPTMAAGSEEWAILDEIKPQATDLVVPKHRRSFFVDTPLHSILTGNAIKVILMTGIATERGILDSSRDALLRGIIPLIVEDAVGSRALSTHEAGMAALREICETTTVSDVVAAWNDTASKKGS